MTLLEVAAEQASKPDSNVVAGVGLVLLIAGITGLWALVHLRGKTHDRLRSPIDLAFAGLTDQAFTSLRALQAHLDEILPDPDTDFNPLDLIVDPSSVERPAKHSIRVLKERHKIHKQFQLLLIVCSLLMYSVGTFAVLVLASTLLYQFSFANKGLWQLSFWVTVAAAACVAGLFITYSVLVGRIQGSIEDANPRPAPRTGALSR